MEKIIRKNILRVQSGITFLELVDIMLSSKIKNAEHGLVVVEDEKGQLVGVITDGDIRRAISRKLPYDAFIGSLVSKDPVLIEYSDNRGKCLQKIRSHEVRLKKEGRWYRPGQILVIDGRKKVVGLVDKKELLNLSTEDLVAVNLGLGFVGLPFSAIVANAGIQVVGVDIKEEVVEFAKKGKAIFFESGLDDLLQTQLSRKTLSFSTKIPDGGADVYFISVGSPVDESGKANLEYLESTARSIGKSLIGNELVAVRSTVQLGATRNHLVPIMEEESGLKAGVDFYVVFTPERVVEGKVIEEYANLPQIIGGLTPYCLKRGISVFSRFHASLVETESLEAAELIKLANNTVRDLTFAYGNEIALICDKYNIDARKLIEAANEGYPRSAIALPSPGVGGMCLPKDSRLYTNSDCSYFGKAKLGEVAREINESMPKYIHLKISEWKEEVGLKWRELRVTIFGAAFKGMPETSDLRNSPSLDVMNLLKNEGVELLMVRDCNCREEELKKVGFDGVWGPELDLSSKGINCILILNNHISHRNLKWHSILSGLPRPALVFDAWAQMNENTVLSYREISYGRMGGIIYE